MAVDVNMAAEPWWWMPSRSSGRPELETEEPLEWEQAEETECRGVHDGEEADVEGHWKREYEAIFGEPCVEGESVVEASAGAGEHIAWRASALPATFGFESRHTPAGCAVGARKEEVGETSAALPSKAEHEAASVARDAASQPEEQSALMERWQQSDLASEGTPLGMLEMVGAVRRIRRPTETEDRTAQVESPSLAGLAEWLQRELHDRVRWVLCDEELMDVPAILEDGGKTRRGKKNRVILKVNPRHKGLQPVVDPFRAGAGGQKVRRRIEMLYETAALNAGQTYEPRKRARVTWSCQTKCVVRIANYREGDLWFRQAGQSTSCSHCDTRVPTSFGRLFGDQQRTHFAKHVFLCGDCMQRSLSQGGDDCVSG